MSHLECEMALDAGAWGLPECDAPDEFRVQPDEDTMIPAVGVLDFAPRARTCTPAHWVAVDPIRGSDSPALRAERQDLGTHHIASISVPYLAGFGQSSSEGPPGTASRVARHSFEVHPLVSACGSLVGSFTRDYSDDVDSANQFAIPIQEDFSVPPIPVLGFAPRAHCTLLTNPEGKCVRMGWTRLSTPRSQGSRNQEGWEAAGDDANVAESLGTAPQLPSAPSSAETSIMHTLVQEPEPSDLAQGPGLAGGSSHDLADNHELTGDSSSAEAVPSSEGDSRPHPVGLPQAPSIGGLLGTVLGTQVPPREPRFGPWDPGPSPPPAQALLPLVGTADAVSLIIAAGGGASPSGLQPGVGQSPSASGSPSERSRMLNGNSIESFFRASTSGPLDIEDLDCKHRPIFTIIQAIVALGLWFVTALQIGGWPGLMGVEGGLELLWPGESAMVVHDGCEDHRQEVWRYLSYQFTHVNFQHVVLNLAFVCLNGTRSEGIHGHVRVACVFNAGVAGAAVSQAIADPHFSALIGMSGGCYALIGMQLADLLINWKQTRCRYALVLALAAQAGIELICLEFQAADFIQSTDVIASTPAHIGGYLTGICSGVFVNRNLKVKRCERLMQAFLFALFVAALSFAATRLAAWPPRALWESAGWCWVGQAYNPDLFGSDSWWCVKCAGQSCVDYWLQQPDVLTVRPEQCTPLNSFYGHPQ